MNFLKKLGIKTTNPGACAGSDGWLQSSSETIESINPANEKVIAAITAASEQDYATIISKAEQAYSAWRQVPAPQRGDIIRQISNKLREVKTELGTLVSTEMGKSLAEGLGEVQEMIDMADFAVGQSRMLYGKTMHSERPEHRMYEQWHPLGVVGIITAFNFPVAVWAWNAFIAAICGNVCVWKPSEKTPLCAVALQNICNAVLTENNMPAVFSFFVPKDLSLAEKMVADKRINLISFTGSTPTGRQVAAVVAKRLGRSLLELGGNNALIIDETADLNIAVPAIVFGSVGTTGQRCTSTRRIMIHQDIYDQLLEKLVKAYQQVTIGDPTNQKNLMGPLIDQAAVDCYVKAIEELKLQGATIAFGGNALDQKGFYVEPTIVEAISDWPLVQRETFAPILYVMKFAELSEAIAMQNSVSQGLSSALFTQDLKRAEYYLSTNGSDCGISNINIGTSGAEIGGAFGGEKDTGGGRESGSDAWKAYMRRQTNTINWSDTLPLAQGIQFELS